MDDRWLDVETCTEGHYSIYQYGTGSGNIIEITNGSRHEMSTLEVAMSRFSEPNFSLKEIYSLDANKDISCVQEGRYQD